MTRDDVTRWARAAGMDGMLTDVVCTFGELERFAALVAAHEREACARVCDGIEDAHRSRYRQDCDDYYQGKSAGADECGSAIRARSALKQPA